MPATAAEHFFGGIMKKIIFDTDIGGDCDDAGALALLHEAQKLGLIELIGIVLSTPRPYTAACVDAINRWYNNIVPIGQTDLEIPDDSGAYEGTYGTEIGRMYENSYGMKLGDDTSLRILRKLLSENEGVTIVITGYMTNVAQLLMSGPDDISPLTGKELARKSIAHMVVMAGEYVEHRLENNIYCDIPMAKVMFKEYEGTMDLLGATEGRRIKTGQPLLDRHDNNPAAKCYEIHSHGARYSWDPITAFIAVYGTEDTFRLSEPGTVTLDEEGVTTFTPCADGKHRIITIVDEERATKRIDNAMLGIL